MNDLSVPSIDKDLAEVLAKLETTGKKRIAAEPNEVSKPRVDDMLAERGFPARHRAHLPTMHGPSLDCAKKYLPRILAGDSLFLLVGDRGPGKTQMATWWAAQRILAGKHVGWYRKTADLITEIKTTWADGGKSVGTESDILKKYRQAAYLVLDEFHERGSSEWEARTLINILDHRYDSMLVTVLIANLTEKQVRAEINPSILSRAEETGGLLVCDWPSYRTQP